MLGMSYSPTKHKVVISNSKNDVSTNLSIIFLLGLLPVNLSNTHPVVYKGVDYLSFLLAARERTLPNNSLLFPRGLSFFRYRDGLTCTVRVPNGQTGLVLRVRLNLQLSWIMLTRPD